MPLPIERAWAEFSLVVACGSACMVYSLLGPQCSDLFRLGGRDQPARRGARETLCSRRRGRIRANNKHRVPTSG
eukprot:9130958-Pyramimonas_sp.AAC.1